CAAIPLLDCLTVCDNAYLVHLGERDACEFVPQLMIGESDRHSQRCGLAGNDALPGWHSASHLERTRKRCQQHRGVAHICAEQRQANDGKNRKQIRDIGRRVRAKLSKHWKSPSSPLDAWLQMPCAASGGQVYLPSP